MVNIRIKRVREGNDLPLPSYKTDGAAGVDLCAHVPHEGLPLYSRVPTLVPCGISIALPPGIEAQVRTRSGLALRNHLEVINSPGTIDSDYRGEICALMFNHSDRKFVVERGMRIAQMTFAHVIKAEWQEVDELPSTERGSGGFGSTGV